MSVLELFGFGARLLLSVLFEEDDTRNVLNEYLNTAKEYRKWYGPFTGLILVTVFAPDAARLIDQIDKSVLQAESDVIKDFIKSFDSGFGMTAIAGAIFAQISLTALDLDDADPSDSMSWVVNTCFLVALMCSLFSLGVTFFAFPTLKTLTTTAHIKEWLSQDERESRASAYAVMMLLAPGRLLSIAISALLVGFGMLLGLLYTKGPAISFGRFGALATLLTYILASLFGFMVFFLPQAMKTIETRKARAYKKSKTVDNQSSGQLLSPSQQPDPNIESQRSHRSQRSKTFLATGRRRVLDAGMEDQETYSMGLLPSSQSRNSSMTTEYPETGHTERRFDSDRLLPRPDVE